MLPTLHIIANCSETKGVAVPPQLRLRSLPKASVQRRAIRWWNRVTGYKGETIAALDLYAGGHWAVVKTLPDLAHDFGFRSKLWIISAGYGLIPADVPLHPYSATFSSGHADSVVQSVSNSQSRLQSLTLWWETLCSFPGPDPSRPHSFKELVSTSRNAYFLIVASPNYLSAIERDVVTSVETISEPDRILIVTSRDGLRMRTLSRNLIRSDARLQTWLGGARVSLNARVASMIIMNSGSWGLGAEALSKKLNVLIARSPALPKYDRKRMTDAQITGYIRKRLKVYPQASCSSLLRSFRDSKFACEQQRFKGLYREVREDLS